MERDTQTERKKKEKVISAWWDLAFMNEMMFDKFGE